MADQVVAGARNVVASGAGLVLAGAAGAVAAVRSTAKPLHPRGTTWSATLVRRGGSTSGSSWLDEPGTDRALVRRSRALGLPDSWPDVHGLAIRAELADGGRADVLLATTGAGSLGRFMLRAGRRPESMFFGTLLPYRSRLGPVSLGALLRPDASWDVFWARNRAPWTPFAQLLVEEQVTGEDVSFDPVLNPPPGLQQYDTWTRMRLPAYRTARRSRGDSIATAETGTATG